MARSRHRFRKRRYLWIPAFLFLLLGIWLGAPRSELPARLTEVSVAVAPVKPFADSPLDIFIWPAVPADPEPLPDRLFTAPEGKGKAVPPVQPEPDLAPAPGRRPRIAIVIDDVGPDRPGARRAIALPAPVTLAILPYAENARGIARQARARGHELLIHVPMEPLVLKGNNPGPNALLTDLPLPEIRRRLELDFRAFDGYVGVNNHMGSRFTAYRVGMQVVLGELAARQLLFLDSRTTANSVAPEIAAKLGLRLARRDIFLDNEIDSGAIHNQLQATEAHARRHGSAIAIGHPHPATLAALAAWLPGLERKGFELVPVSALARQPSVE